MSDKLPRMDYRQHRRARRLVHECCNYDEGNCLLYCPGCAGRMKKIKAAERKRKQRQRCHALEPFKPA